MGFVISKHYRRTGIVRDVNRPFELSSLFNGVLNKTGCFWRRSAAALQSKNHHPKIVFLR